MMNQQQVVDLYNRMLAAAPGEAMRLGVAGNTPDDIRERWARQQALSDYHDVLRRQARRDGVEAPRGRIFGLAAVGEAYGDVDRLRASGTLLADMEEHLDFGRGEADEEVLRRATDEAIKDAQNPERNARVPASDQVPRWWARYRGRYESADVGGSALIDADDAVRLLRRRVVDALRHGQRLAEDPRRRAEAEQYIKQQLREADEHVELATRKYQAAANEFRERRERQESVDRTEATMRRREDAAREKAAALQRYSVVLAVAGKRTTPFMAGMRRSLGERFPHQEQAILETRAGQLAAAASVEAALRLTPKDPQRWDPEGERFSEKAQEYFSASGKRDGFDGLELEADRHRRPTLSVRGQALAMACYDVMNEKQRSLSDRWAAVTEAGWNPARGDRLGHNSVEAAGYARTLGIPPMPAAPETAGAEQINDVLAAQERMVSVAETEARVYAVAPPSPVPEIDLSRTLEG